MDDKNLDFIYNKYPPQHIVGEIFSTSHMMGYWGRRGSYGELDIKKAPK
jgi:hypothetical protein